MRRGIRTASRQSQPFSLLRLQRTVKHSVYGAESQPKTINCLDTRTGEQMMVSESETYGAVCNSFCTLNRRPLSVVMRELLEAGFTLANSKGFFSYPVKETPPARNIIHEARDGRRLLLAEMADDHLLNTLPFAVANRPFYIEEALRRGLITEEKASQLCPIWRNPGFHRDARVCVHRRAAALHGLP
jgi:hypothetical protein